MEDIYEMQSSSDAEQIMVPCEHCSNYVNLAVEDVCPNCNLSVFLSPDEIA